MRADGMALPTFWGFQVVEMRSVLSGSRWNVITHPLRVTSGGNEISIELGAYGMEFPTNWEFKVDKTRSVSVEQQMERNYPPTESLKRSKWHQHRMTCSWNVITHRLRVPIGRNGINVDLPEDGTHQLRVQCGRNELSIEWTTHGLPVRTFCLG